MGLIVTEIGSQWIIRGRLWNGTVVYYNKSQEYVENPAHATFAKSKKKAEKTIQEYEDWYAAAKSLNENHADNALKFEDVNAHIDWEVKEVKMEIVE